MMQLGAWVMLLIFATGAALSFWRWKHNGRAQEMFWRGATLTAGTLVYLYIVTPTADLNTARWLVRVLLVSLLLPLILQDLEELGAKRRDEH